jgi:hypothetical protein
MIEASERIKVTCTGCGRVVYVGNDPNYDCIPVTARFAPNPEWAAMETLMDNHNWSQGDEGEYCPDCEPK